MSTPTRSVYLSAVCDELKSYRDELARNLTQRGLLVKSRQDFHDDGNLLEHLEEFIRRCDVVICLVGNQFGDEPAAEEAETFADISKNRHSYAQWEYLFGAHVGKAVYAFCPTDDLPRDSRNDESADLAELQNQFRLTWVESGVNGKPIEFNDLVSLRVEALVLNELTPDVVDPQIARKLDLENPYVGLRKFTENDASKFFGRKKLVGKIISQIGNKPLLTVFGASGSGKSSVMRAGVIPQFLKQYPGGKVISFSPGANPFTRFANALTRAGLPEDVAAIAAEPSSEVFSKVRKAAGNLKDPWLILIDPFEEIFTCPEKGEAALVFQFVQSLIDMAQIGGQTPMRVVLAVRDDFIGRLSEYSGLAELTDQNIIRVTRPGWEEMCEIIEMPAAAHGVRFEPGLVSRIVSHVEGEAQNLPMLQYALYRLWEVEKADMGQFAEGALIDDEDKEMGGLHDRKINRISYKALSGVPNALATRINELFGNATLQEQARLRRILLSLVTIGHTDTGLVPVGRTASLHSLQKAGGVNSLPMIEKLIEESLLVESECGDQMIDLAHESLISGWRDLSKWVNDSRDAVELRDALQTDSRVWETKSAERTASFQDLWGGAKLERARELCRINEDTGRSDFDRVGGLDDLSQDFLEASGDRLVKETRVELAESAATWKQNGKSKDALWSGAKLHRAVELNQLQAGETQSGFDRLGGLEKLDKKFLAASEKNARPKPTFTYAALIAAIVAALLAFFTPIEETIKEAILGSKNSSPANTESNR